MEKNLKYSRSVLVMMLDITYVWLLLIGRMCALYMSLLEERVWFSAEIDMCTE